MAIESNHLSQIVSPELPFALFEDYLDEEEASRLLRHCLTDLPWQTEQIRMFGQCHLAPRLSCSLGDDGLKYRYRGAQGATYPFTSKLNEVRLRLQGDFGNPFNFVLANRYRSGSDYVGWHADDEKDLIRHGTIASLSLGATRTFRLRDNRTRSVHSIQLKHRALLIMIAGCQENFKHTLVKTNQTVAERVNLSYRCVSN